MVVWVVYSKLPPKNRLLPELVFAKFSSGGWGGGGGGGGLLKGG